MNLPQQLGYSCGAWHDLRTPPRYLAAFFSLARMTASIVIPHTLEQLEVAVVSGTWTRVVSYLRHAGGKWSSS